MNDIAERLRNCVKQRYDIADDLALEAADEIERLRNDRDDSDAASIDREAEIERLRSELEGKISQSYAAELARQVGELETENERLRGHVSNSLAVLNACRIAIKNRDQRPDEMKLLDAIKIAVANAEDVLGVVR